MLISIARCVSVCYLVAGASIALAQSFPVKPIRVFTAEVGGGSDFVARLVAQGLSGSFGQQVIVENRGGNALIAGEAVAKAPPDGYTLLFHGNPIWFLPLLQDNFPLNAVKDLAPISLVDSSPLVLVVHPSLPVKSVSDLIALARHRPGALNYATGPAGTTPHLSAELLKSMAGIRIECIFYRGAGPALNDMIAGHVQIMFATTAAGMPHVKSGRLRALAVTSVKPSALVPGLPTIAASGLPGYESVNVHGLFAPANTPAALITRFNEETLRYLNLPETKERFLKAGIEPVGSTAEEFSAAIKSDVTLWGKIIKEAGIRLN